MGKINIGLEFFRQLLVFSKFFSMVKSNGMDTVFMGLHAISNLVFYMLSCFMPSRPQ